MRAKNSWALAGLVTLAGVGLVVPATAASASETFVYLPGLSEFGGMLVDDTNHHVYVTGGERQGGDVLVLDSAGKYQQTVGLTGYGAGEMALSPDGKTLYVGLARRTYEGIAAIDVATMTQRQIFPAPQSEAGACPVDLATAGDLVWFTYGCNTGQAGLGSLNPATGTYSLDLVPATVNPGPVSVSKNRLLTAGNLYDIASGKPVLTGPSAGPSAGGKLNADGSRILSTSASPAQGVALSSTDLKVAATYPVDGYPSSITDSGDDSTVAVGGTVGYFPAFWIYSADGKLQRSRQIVSGEGFRSLALNQDGSKAYLATNLSHSVRLRVFDSNDLSSTLTLTGPTTGQRGQEITIDGTFSGPNRTLQITRTDQAGTHALEPVSSNESGLFSFTDTPTIGAGNTYTVKFAGDAYVGPKTATKAVDVARTATSVAIATDKAGYAYGARATVTAKVGKFHDGRTICFYATPAGGARSLIRCVTGNTSGVATTAYTMTRRTAFTATYAGDQWYAPATSPTRTVTTAARIAEKLSGAYKTKYTYFVFHQKTNPTLTAAVAPSRPGACVKFTTQAWRNGTWKNVATTGCVKLGRTSRAAAQYRGTHAKHTSYRIRAAFVGDSVNTTAYGPWLKFQFTK
ncbi:YncE family protein [Micromonosporaceae bacterium Da 78-11]